jgi:VanZ family protein
MASSHPNDSIPSASTFVRGGLLAYTFLIVYASWYPFSGWHRMGVSPFAYLFAPLPHYWTVFDLLTNIVGYIPLGILTVFAMYPRIRGIVAALIASLFGLLLSGLMEAVQTYLPTRVASNLDLMTNFSGAVIGAISALFLTRLFFEHSRLLYLRRNWFSREASHGLIVVGLWPLAQIYPQGYLFGHGQLTPMLSEWLSDWLDTPVDLSDWLRHGHQLTVEQYWLSESIITACGVTGALLTLLCLLRNRAPKFVLVSLLLASTLLAKSLASALQFSPENAFVWMTPGAEGGLLLGIVMISGLILAPPIAQRRVAVLTLLISLAVVNAAPANPYFVATLQTWVQGKFLNFDGAAQFLSLLWPFLALWFLLHSSLRRKPE